MCAKAPEIHVLPRKTASCMRLVVRNDNTSTESFVTKLFSDPSKMEEQAKDANFQIQVEFLQSRLYRKCEDVATVLASHIPDPSNRLSSHARQLL